MSESDQSRLAELYARRFPKEMHERRRRTWQLLYREWFGRYVHPGYRVLEIAPGYCEFINNVPASHERVGVDLNPDCARFAAPGVVVHPISAERMTEKLPPDHFDLAFASNFFEHCESRAQLLAVLKATLAVLRPGGKFLILGPNFKHTLRQYFDYFDHQLALTDASMAEALELAGFEIETNRAQTLPFTMRTRLPTHPLLIALYLRFPPAWKILGSQFFIVAVKPERRGATSFV